MSEVEAEQETLEGLNRALFAQKQVLDDSEQRMNKTRNSGGGQADFLKMNEDLRLQKDGLQELERQYSAAKTRATQVGSEGKQTLGQEKYNQQQDDQAITAQIQAKQLEVNQTNGQLVQLKKNSKYNSDVQQKIPSVEAQLQEQKAGLQQLKDQKLNYAQQWNSQRGLSQVQIEAQQGSVRASEAQLRDQIQGQRVAVQQAERTIQDSKNAQAGQRETLGLLERDFQNQKIKFQDIQKQVLEQQKKVESLKDG